MSEFAMHSSYQHCWSLLQCLPGRPQLHREVGGGEGEGGGRGREKEWEEEEGGRGGGGGGEGEGRGRGRGRGRGEKEREEGGKGVREGVRSGGRRERQTCEGRGMKDETHLQ